MARKSPTYTDDQREALRAAGRRVRQIQKEMYLRGHGCVLCPFHAIPDDLPIEEKQRRANLQWRIHLIRANDRKSQLARERKLARLNGGE